MAAISDHDVPTLATLTITARVEPESVTLALRGELDLASVGRLRSELLAAEQRLVRRIVLDLSGLGFMDSSGIHVLVEAQRRADARGHQLVLTGVPDQARRLFRLTGLTSQLTVASA